ncbi:hypothetical protein B0H13DRAFT_1897883 [Mycena leptocephala]|nr:hypothetical protein B0H13DRAFT_1897883 [Mycena leptocephala]
MYSRFKTAPILFWSFYFDFTFDGVDISCSARWLKLARLSCTAASLDRAQEYMLEYERPKRASAGKYVGRAEGYGMRWRYHALECALGRQAIPRFARTDRWNVDFDAPLDKTELLHGFGGCAVA